MQATVQFEARPTCVEQGLNTRLPREILLEAAVKYPKNVTQFVLRTQIVLRTHLRW
jgi:hypothetical protein